MHLPYLLIAFILGVIAAMWFRPVADAIERKRRRRNALKAARFPRPYRPFR